MELRLKWIRLKKDIKRASRELEFSMQNINSIIDKEKEEDDRIRKRINKIYNNDL